MFAAGNSVSASSANYIEDIFSTYLYTGNGTTQTITNGIDLAGKGGLVWVKRRDAVFSHNLVDSVRGNGNVLSTDTTDQQLALGRISIAANGFDLTNNSSSTNFSAGTYASWTFREQPKFFDVVTYTGTGVARTVAHNLGSAPGCMIIKRTDAAGNAWYVYHRSLGATKVIYLNQTDAAATVTSPWNDTEPTSTEFTVGANNNNNASGGSFVAYLFAHNAGGFGLTGTDNVVSCGSFTTDAGGTATVNLGYEPQWLMVKTSSAVSNWWLGDVMRGMSLTGSMANLFPNLSNAEGTDVNFRPTSTGFTAAQAGASRTLIYVAIRRGPMKVPTLGTSVYNAVARTGTGAAATVTGLGFTPDLIHFQARSGNNSGFSDKLRGTAAQLYSTLTNTEFTATDDVTAFGMNGVSIGTGATGQAINTNAISYINHFFQRAPGFFDEVCWTGDGTQNRAIAHNLNVAPELIITKTRNSGSFSWFTYTAITGLGGSLFVNNTSELNTGAGALAWGSTAFNSSNFYISGPTAGYSGINGSGTTYVGYLFATCPGVSKVGSYTGTAALQTVACGFTSGARFVLIKRTDAVGDWYYWDSTRGITSGNDPYLLMNSTAAEVTGTNYVDTDTTGFKLTAAAPAALNAVGGTYIFLAIA